MAGHALGALDQLVAAALVDVSAVIANLHEPVTVAETGERIPNGAAGQVALHGRLDGGARALAEHPRRQCGHAGRVRHHDRGHRRHADRSRRRIPAIT